MAEIEDLYKEWAVAYRAKGGRITVHGEELFSDFFEWLKWKKAECDWVTLSNNDYKRILKLASVNMESHMNVSRLK